MQVRFANDSVPFLLSFHIIYTVLEYAW